MSADSSRVQKRVPFVKYGDKVALSVGTSWVRTANTSQNTVAGKKYPLNSLDMTQPENFQSATKFIIRGPNPETSPAGSLVKWNDIVVLEAPGKGQVFALEPHFCRLVDVQSAKRDDPKVQWKIVKRIGNDKQFVSYSDTLYLSNQYYGTYLYYVPDPDKRKCISEPVPVQFTSSYTTDGSKAGTRGNVVSILLPNARIAQPTVPVCTECTGDKCTDKRTGNVTASYVCKTNTSGVFTVPSRNVRGDRVMCQCRNPGIGSPDGSNPYGGQCLEGKCNSQGEELESAQGTQQSSNHNSTGLILLLVVGLVGLIVGFLVYRYYQRSRETRAVGEETTSIG
jgi:hypothetical protein